MANHKIEPFTIKPEDQEMVISALHEYKRLLARASNGKGADLYGRLISRADAMFMALWKNRYGNTFGASDPVEENDNG